MKRDSAHTAYAHSRVLDELTSIDSRWQIELKWQNITEKLFYALSALFFIFFKYCFIHDWVYSYDCLTRFSALLVSFIYFFRLNCCLSPSIKMKCTAGTRASYLLVLYLTFFFPFGSIGFHTAIVTVIRTTWRITSNARIIISQT